MTHDEIQKLAYLADMMGSVSAMASKELGEFPSVYLGTVFECDNVLSEHYNLLRAAPILYQSLTGTYTIAEGVISALERYRGPERQLIEIILQQMSAIQQSVLLAQSVAVNGIESVRTEIQAQSSAYAKEKPK